MIREEEMRKTLSLLSTRTSKRRAVSYSERYRNMDAGIPSDQATTPRTVRGRLASFLRA
jgi:hypothetical protein